MNIWARLTYFKLVSGHAPLPLESGEEISNHSNSRSVSYSRSSKRAANETPSPKTHTKKACKKILTPGDSAKSGRLKVIGVPLNDWINGSSSNAYPRFPVVSRGIGRYQSVSIQHLTLLGLAFCLIRVPHQDHHRHIFVIHML